MAFVAEYISKEDLKKYDIINDKGARSGSGTDGGASTKEI